MVANSGQFTGATHAEKAGAKDPADRPPGAAAARAGLLAALGPDATAVLPVPPPGTPRRRWRPRPAETVLAAALAAALAALAAVLLTGTAGTAGTAAQPARPAATRPAPGATSSRVHKPSPAPGSRPKSPAAVLPPAAAATAAFVGDLQAGVADGQVAQQAGQDLFSHLQPLLFGPPGQDARQIQQQYAQLVQAYDQHQSQGQITGQAGSPATAGAACAACTAGVPGICPPSSWRTCARWLATLSFCLVSSSTSRWVAARRRSASALTSASGWPAWVFARSGAGEDADRRLHPEPVAIAGMARNTLSAAAILAGVLAVVPDSPVERSGGSVAGLTPRPVDRMAVFHSPPDTIVAFATVVSWAGAASELAKHRTVPARRQAGRFACIRVASSQVMTSLCLGQAAGQFTDVAGADQLAHGRVTGRRHGPELASGAAAPDPPPRILAPEPVKPGVPVITAAAGGHGGRRQAAAPHRPGR